MKTNTLTINYGGIDFECEIDYQPFEPQTLEYPGSPAYVEVIGISYFGVDFWEVFFGYGQTEDHFHEVFDKLAEEAIREMHEL